MIFEFFTSGNVALMVYPLFCTLFCDTNRNLNHKTLQQRFLKEFKATCKDASESEVKQQKQLEMRYGLVMH